MSTKSPNSIDRHVGSRVRMRRMLIGMSQEKLGQTLGVTFQQVQKYEKGTNRIGASRLQHIASVLGVSVDFLFEGAPRSWMAGGRDAAGLGGGAPRPSTWPDFLSTAEGVQLMKLLSDRLIPACAARDRRPRGPRLAGEEND
jgi:transcriptional regulator with XRE-family HTH domain